MIPTMPTATKIAGHTTLRFAGFCGFEVYFMRGWGVLALMLTHLSTRDGAGRALKELHCRAKISAGRGARKWEDSAHSEQGSFKFGLGGVRKAGWPKLTPTTLLAG
jgi:hypothetical protein